MSVRIDDNNIFLTRGDSLYLRVRLMDKRTREIYEPVQGDRLRFAVKKDYGDTEKLIEKEIPTDTMVLYLAPADTKRLDFGKYVYDIELTYADGDVCTAIPPDPGMKAVFRLGNEVC